MNEMANRIARLPYGRVQRVAVDGVDGAGKTVLANHLAQRIESLGRPVIRASVDGFHNCRDIRYRLGKTSPEGFYRESYNYPLLRQLLLDPLSPGGSGAYRTEAYDVDRDAVVSIAVRLADRDSILIFDGIFLHRKELKSYWDFSIFLKVPFEVSIPRAAQRGTGSADPLAASNHRYVEGQKLYLEESRPELSATIVVDYRDLDCPAIEFENKN